MYHKNDEKIWHLKTFNFKVQVLYIFNLFLNKIFQNLASASSQREPKSISLQKAVHKILSRKTCHAIFNYKTLHIFNKKVIKTNIKIILKRCLKLCAQDKWVSINNILNVLCLNKHCRFFAQKWKLALRKLYLPYQIVCLLKSVQEKTTYDTDFLPYYTHGNMRHTFCWQIYSTEYRVENKPEFKLFYQDFIINTIWRIGNH